MKPGVWGLARKRQAPGPLKGATMLRDDSNEHVEDTGSEIADGSNYRVKNDPGSEPADGSNYREEEAEGSELADGSSYRVQDDPGSTIADGSNYRDKP